MNNVVEAGKTGEIGDGTMKQVVAQGREILLARVGGKYYAADNRCSHMGGKLSQGKLEGTVVTCPRHGSRFDLRDGRVVRWLESAGLVARLGRALKPPRPLEIYRVRVEGGKVLVEI